jgi:poly(3-hydroxyalkanoate) synthetase
LGNPEFWGKHSQFYFQLLAPKNNTFHHNEKNYHLSRHGFAREMEFQLIDSTENSATFYSIF